MVARIVAIALAVVSFVGMAFKFMGVESLTKTYTYGMKDWFELVDQGVKFEAKGFGWWQMSKILMIVTLIVVAVLAVIAIIQFFTKHKVFNLLMKIVSVVCIVVAAMFIITYIIGIAVIEGDLLMNVAPFVIGLSAVGGSVAGLLSAKK